MKRPGPLAAVVAAAAAAVGLAGCGAGTSADGDAGTVPTVLAAASLTEVLPIIEPRARYSFGGSDQLAFQLEQGAPADVLAAASPRYPQALFAKGIVERPRTFATNRVVVIVPRGNPAGIRRPDDLARPGVKVVIAARGVPVSDYTRTAVAQLGIEGALRNVVSEEPDVKGVRAKVALGQADAGFVYASDVRPVRPRVRVIRLPATAQPDIEYQVAVVVDAQHPAAARAFVDALVSPAGRRALVANGFGVPPR